MKRVYLYVAILGVFSLMMLQGCCWFKETAEWAFDDPQCQTPDCHEEAGSTHVAVLSVTPWEEAASELQPHFDMDVDKALKETIQITQRFEEKTLDAFSAHLKLGLTQGITSETKPSEIASIKEPSPITTKETSSLPGKSPFEGPIGMDPMIKYLAASALFQEVKLLNRYVSDASLRDYYKPYVVRLQVSVMPKKRNLPYDTYMNISFFSEFTKPPRDKNIIKEEEALPLAYKTPEFAENPIVIPLLVTDNLEAEIYAHSAEVIRQYALSIMAAMKGVGGQLDLEKLNKDLQSILGQNLNSILTVARLSVNTLRVRLGAMQQAASYHAMVPRTHNISLLLLVPKNHVLSTNSSITAYTHTSFVDAKSGREPLPGRTNEDLKEKFKKISKEWDGIEITSDLVNIIDDNDYPGFIRALKEKAAIPVILIDKEIQKTIAEISEKQAKGGNAEELIKKKENLIEKKEKLVKKRDGSLKTIEEESKQIWVDIVSGPYIGTRYDITTFTLPRINPELPSPAQTVFLIDDGKKIIAVLNGGKYLDLRRMKVLFTIDNYKLVPEEISLTKEKGLKLTFPSLVDFQSNPQSQSSINATLEIELLKDVPQSSQIVPVETDLEEGKDIEISKLSLTFTAKDNSQNPANRIIKVQISSPPSSTPSIATEDTFRIKEATEAQPLQASMARVNLDLFTLNQIPDIKNPNKKKLKLNLAFTPRGYRIETIKEVYKGFYIQKTTKSEKPPMTMNITTENIVLDKERKGRINLQLKGKIKATPTDTDKYIFKVDNASVEEPPMNILTTNDVGEWEIIKIGSQNLTLFNLVPNTVVEFKIEKKGDASVSDSKKLRVVSMDSEQKKP